MDGPEVELSTTAALLAGDDGADVSAVMQAHVNMVMAVGRRARARGIARGRQYHGPTAGRRGNTRGDFAAGVHNILRNYFDVGGLPPICDERDFETRFRVPRAVFRRVYLAVKDEPFFQQRINATGKLQAHPLQKVVAAFPVIAYGEAADRADEYCNGSQHHHFGSSSSRSELLISSVRRRNCPGNRLTAQPSPNGRRGSRQSPGGNRSPKHCWFYQTAVATTSPLSTNPSPTRAPAGKVATPNAPNR